MKHYIAPSVIAFVILFCFFLAVILFSSKEIDFAGGGKALSGNIAIVPGSAAQGAKAAGEYTVLSLGIFGTILVLQLTALFSSTIVVRKIKLSGDSPSLKLRRLSNADIFMDLPLYIGLFGTVSSFILITFCPQFSRLIAYASTIIGILISVSVRTLILFPYREELLAAENAAADGEGEEAPVAVSRSKN